MSGEGERKMTAEELAEERAEEEAHYLQHLRDQFALCVSPMILEKVLDRHVTTMAQAATMRIMGEIEQAMQKGEFATVGMLMGKIKEAQTRVGQAREHIREQAYPEAAEETWRYVDTVMRRRSGAESREPSES